MITHYYRPQNLDEAVKLLAQAETYPLGGGTWLNQSHDEKFKVVDLQALGLNKIRKNGINLEIDACVTLQQIIESPDCPAALQQATNLEAVLNIRNAATVAGTLVTCDGRSTFAAAMLALDAKLTCAYFGVNQALSTTSIGLGEFLPLRARSFITSVSIPLNTKSAFDSVARTPKDRPIVCAAVVQWSSGRTRLVLGGCRNSPTLAMDGTEPDGLETAARSAFHEAGDEWASSEYRSEVAATLARRCLESLG